MENNQPTAASLTTLNGSTELAEFLLENLAKAEAHRIGDDILVIKNQSGTIEVVDAAKIRQRRQADAETLEIEMRAKRLANEASAPNPLRIRANVLLAQPAAFVLYVNDFKNSGCTQLFADMTDTGGEIVAIFDFHDKNDTETAGWCKHRARLLVRTSVEYNEWAAAKSGMGQQAFCDFLEDHAHEIVEPDSARLLEICSALTGKVEMKVAGVARQAGKTAISFSEETTVGQSTPAGMVNLPDRMKIRIPIFDGEESTEIDCRLRAGVRDNKLSLAVTLPGVREKIKAAIDTLVDRIGEETEINVLRGVAPT